MYGDEVNFDEFLTLMRMSSLAGGGGGGGGGDGDKDVSIQAIVKASHRDILMSPSCRRRVIVMAGKAGRKGGRKEGGRTERGRSEGTVADRIFWRHAGGGTHGAMVSPRCADPPTNHRPRPRSFLARRLGGSSEG